ncbi:MAG TPA: DUF1963 domain-containing protein [Candidatus Limnocylindrales bacterium]|nr:DUF1963 domain-containing protein [Candidatus Limnocylindrales bacterium]
MNRFLAALNAFFLLLFGQTIALAVAEGFGGLHIDPFGSRKALFFVTLAVSVAGAILRWTRFRERTAPAGSAPRTGAGSRPAAAPQPAAGPLPADSPLPLSEPAAQMIAAAARQAIVFRQHFPPRHEPAERSFFGGAPFAPRGFAWPRSHNPKSQGQPLHFVLQVDCAAVPEAARLDALPSRGVLYFFLDMSWEIFEAGVVHADAPAGDWESIAPPGDLGPAFGKHAASHWGWTQSLEQCPILLPKWTFDPIVIELPERVLEEVDEGDGPYPALWPGDAAAERLLEAQGDPVRYDYLTVRDVIDGTSVRRPFAAFPHDWRALQICSAELVRQADRQRRYPDMGTFRDMDSGAKATLLTEISAEAQSWFDRAAAQPAFDEVPAADRDAFWELIARHPSLTRYMLVDALTQSIESSLSHSARAAARVPSEIADRIRGRHALAVQTDSGIHANIPDRMLAPPVDVQGNQWERAQTHLLLLELSSNQGLGHNFGEGVFQFWITPEDFKASRFDKVEVTADAY